VPNECGVRLSADFADFTIKLFAMAKSSRDRKTIEELIKRSCTSTNPKNSVNIGAIDSQICTVKWPPTMLTFRIRYKYTL